MRISPLNILWFAVFIIAVFGVYAVKFKAQEVGKAVVALRNQIELEENSIHVLKAEWAYLNNPDRIKSLSKKYLKTTQVTARDITSIADIETRALGKDNYIIIKTGGQE